MKRNYFKLLGLFMIFVVGLFALTSCTKSLPAPTNVQINENSVLMWDAVENAKGYKVSVDGTEYDTTTTSYDLSKLNLPVGIHTIKVKALSDSDKLKDSPYSESIKYEITESGPKKLSAPTNVRIEENNLVWSAVSGATSYQIVAGDVVKTTTSTSFALSELGNVEGVLEITVKAVASGYLPSDPSNSVRYVMPLSTATFKNRIKLHLMQNYDYSENSAAENAEYIVEGVFLPIDQYAGLGNAVYLELFQTYFDLIMENPDPMTMLGAFVETALDNRDLAKLLRGVLIYFLEKENTLPGFEDLENEIAYYEEWIAEYEDKIDEIQTEYNRIVAELENSEIYALYLQRNILKGEIAELEQKLYYDYFYENLSGYMSYYTYYSTLESYALVLEWNIADERADLESQYPWLLELTDQMQSFVKKNNLLDDLDNTYDSYSYEEQRKIMDLTIWEDELKTIPYYLDEIEHYRNRIARLEKRFEESQMSYQLLTALIDYLKENETAVLDALMVPVKVVRSGLAENMEELLALLSNPNITPYEIFELKNAFVESIFSFDVMPTKEELANFLNVVKEISALLIDFGKENSEISQEEAEILLSSLENILDYYQAVYVPMLNIYKEVLLAATAEDIEALMSVDSQEKMLEVFTTLAQRIADNPVIAENSALVEEALLDLIFNQGIDALPLVLAYVTGIDAEVVFDIWDILTFDQNITLGALEELSVFAGLAPMSFAVVGNIRDELRPLDVITMIDWSVFAGMTSEDIADTLALAKEILKVVYFYNQKLNPEDYLLTEEQFDEALDMELLGTIIAQAGDFMGQIGTLINDLLNEGIFEEFTVENVIAIAKELAEIYETNDEKIAIFFENLKAFFVDNPLSDEVLGPVTAEEFAEFEQELRNAFEIAITVSLMDPKEITDEEFDTILDLVERQFPIEPLYREVHSGKHQDVYKTFKFDVNSAFEQLVYTKGAYFNQPSIGAFTVEDIVNLLEGTYTIVDYDGEEQSFWIVIELSDGCNFRVAAECGLSYIYYMSSNFSLVLKK